ncbi:Long chain acyl-CoA synthetase 6 [Durusdinium trenchii]|uniref:Long-chain-fatty-acid--CoA ligase n=1 Tax=Durusdinium trenchii TaxID=1381693 RepID=A0ABP0PG83_9DINO
MPVFSHEVPGTEDAERGWGPSHRACDGQEPTLAIFDEQSGDQVKTSYENFQNARRKFSNKPFLGHRPIASDGSAGPYVWSTFEEVGKRAENFGSGLLNLGLCPSRPDPEVRDRGMLGIYAKNRPEWVIAEQGCFTQSIVTVPMYDTLGAESVAYVVKQCNLKTVVCSAETAKSAINCKACCPSLECLILMDVSEDLRSQVTAAGLRVFSVEEVEKEGAAKPRPHLAPLPEDILTFCYTSGTTGDPKGVLVTHENLASAFGASRGRQPFTTLTGDDVLLSYLPLPHIFERMVQFGTLFGGGRIGFYQGDTLKIVDDLQALRPTIFPSVPRLLTRVHDRLLAGVQEAGGLKKVLFDRAYAAKKAALADGKNTHPLWDRLIFSKIAEKVGLNKVRVMITGSAPIADHVLDFLRIVFACPVFEGYGLSETSGAGTVTADGDLAPGTVGAVLSCNELRLKDVPDMGYLRTDQVHKAGEVSIPCHGRGEICFKGTNVFKGYYKMPEKTAEAVDEDGWFHSGDIGMWLPDGRLKIIDRKKNIFKLAQGEYVSPEKIEGLNVQSSFVAQSFVYGDSLKTQLVAVVVPDPDTAASWAKKNATQKSIAELCKDSAFKKAVLSDLQQLARSAKLSGFEVIKAVYLEPTPWDPGGEVLTPTFKLQRNKAKEKYQAQLDQLYAELEAGPPSKL